MKHVTATFAACLASALLMSSATALGSDLLGGRLHTAPDKLYVNQLFEIKFELEIAAGCEVEDLRISDFPNNPDLITVGRLEQLARQRDLERQIDANDEIDQVGDLGAFAPKRLFQQDVEFSVITQPVPNQVQRRQGTRRLDFGQTEQVAIEGTHRCVGAGRARNRYMLQADIHGASPPGS